MILLNRLKFCITPIWMSEFLLLIFQLKLWCCVTIENWIIILLWMVSSIRMLICISKIKAIFFTDNVVVPFICVFSITNNELHQKLCIMALVIRWSSLALNVLSIWQHVATDLMLLNAMTYLKLLSLSISFRNYIMWMVIIIWMSWNLTSSNTSETLSSRCWSRTLL